MAGTPASIAAVVTQCAALGDDVAFHAQLLKTGAPATELASTSGIFLSGGSLDAAAAGEIRSAAFADACPFIASHGVFDDPLAPVFSVAACKTFAGGLLTRGLGGAISQIISLSRDLCSLRAGATTNANGIGTVPSGSGTAPYSIRAVLNGPDVSFLLTLLDTYVAPALKGIAATYGSADIAKLAAQQQFLVFFVAFFLAVFCLFVAVIYLPGVHAVNSEIKQNVRCRIVRQRSTVGLTLPLASAAYASSSRPRTTTAIA